MKRETVSKIVINEIEKLTGYSTQLVDSFIEKRTKLLSTRPNHWPCQSWDEMTMIKDYIDEMDTFLNK